MASNFVEIMKQADVFEMKTITYKNYRFTILRDDEHFITVTIQYLASNSPIVYGKIKIRDDDERHIMVFVADQESYILCPTINYAMSRYSDRIEQSFYIFSGYEGLNDAFSSLATFLQHIQ